MFTLTARESTLVVRIWRLQTSDSDVYRRQILTTKVDPRAVGVKWVNITHNIICLIWDHIVTILDAWTHISLPITVSGY